MRQRRANASGGVGDSGALKRALRRFLGVVALVALSAGCAAVRPDYGPSAGGDRPGYSDRLVGEARYEVRYVGGRGATPALVERGMLYRAAELAVQKGYDGFRLISKETSRPDVADDDLGLGLSVSGGSSSGLGLGIGVPLPVGGTGGGVIESLGRIVLIRAPFPPDDPTVYDARTLLSGGAPK